MYFEIMWLEIPTRYLSWQSTRTKKSTPQGGNKKIPRISSRLPRLVTLTFHQEQPQCCLAFTRILLLNRHGHRFTRADNHRKLSRPS